MGHWLFGKEHEMFRQSVRKFVEKEVTPHIEEWERAGEVPRSLFRRAGELGYLGLKFPEEYGGGNDLLADAIFVEEMSRCGSGGTAAALTAHSGIAVTPIWRFGDEEQKQRYLIPALRGEMIAALGITEPDSGSDVASIRTTARRVGDSYILNGSKTFITNGVNADIVCVAAKTEPEAGHRGISLFVVETKTPGFSVGKNLRKLGWRASDTAELAFEDVRVPAGNRIGQENQGFYYIMQNFQWERILMALSSVASAEKALEQAMRYSRERIQFGVPIQQFQVLQHKMVDMAVDIEKARNLTYWALYQYQQGKDAVTEATMAKAYAGETVSRVSDAALQIHGGAGYMMEYPVQRYWRDARIMSIGGGTTQIMNEILVKQLGINKEEETAWQSGNRINSR
ncbi:acyl-CoA dehydrogenase family protein [Effusibacillus lacus]|uniref:Acyl-CoA dehydrogenase n=1 Tax=Effusibacillus lacus TaxID=1348429 RepID=A0A292YNJ1_9BACL|nr:acyl-CoA dehydrogenase family protein [Effusibacillus lacus]TCS72043.1 acyl-CoA dehydrogenase [Effusibacillus lacus]GAX90333.1 acyl-CoA dehydrogenase [Effusibacillus lacus]